MENPISSHTFRTIRLTPMEAEVEVEVRPREMSSTAEIHGRVVGPFCDSFSTVQISYPLKPVRPGDCSSSCLTARAIIPEPNLWNPESPFFYRVFLELWVDGRCCQKFQTTCRFRVV